MQSRGDQRVKKRERDGEKASVIESGFQVTFPVN